MVLLLLLRLASVVVVVLVVFKSIKVVINISLCARFLFLCCFVNRSLRKTPSRRTNSRGADTQVSCLSSKLDDGRWRAKRLGRPRPKLDTSHLVPLGFFIFVVVDGCVGPAQAAEEAG